MFKTYSAAGLGMYIALATTVIQALNLSITQTQAEALVVAVANIISIILWVYGQFRRQDLVAGIKRRKD